MRTDHSGAFYTNALKLMQMKQYRETGSPSEYKEDPFIPLELGGAPKDPKNLWPEPRSQSRITDPLVTKFKKQVCKGILTLKRRAPPSDCSRTRRDKDDSSVPPLGVRRPYGTVAGALAGSSQSRIPRSPLRR